MIYKCIGRVESIVEPAGLSAKLKERSVIRRRKKKAHVQVGEIVLIYVSKRSRVFIPGATDVYSQGIIVYGTVSEEKLISRLLWIAMDRLCYGQCSRS